MAYNYNPNFTPVPMQQGDDFKPAGGVSQPWGQTMGQLFGGGLGAAGNGIAAPGAPSGAWSAPSYMQDTFQPTAGAGASTPNPTQASSWQGLGIDQMGSNFLADRAGSQTTFQMGPDGQPQWNMPGQSQQPGMTSTGGYGMSSNPYEGAQANDITNRTTTWLNNSLAGIQGNAVGVGGLGGTRQGVAQGGALSQGMDMLSGQLANLYSGNYNQQQNRDLSRYGMDQNFYGQQRGQDLQQLGIGANMYNLGMQGQWSPYQNYSNTLSPYTGFGSNTSTSSTGGGWGGALGGGLSGLALGSKMGWW